MGTPMADGTITKEGSTTSATPAEASAGSATAIHTGLRAGSEDRYARTPPAAETAETAGEMSELRAACLMNARYHSAREGFLDSVHRGLMLGVVICGSGSVPALLSSWSLLPTFLASLAALFGALDLVFDLSNRARAHAMMKRRYFELIADLEEERKSPSEVRGCIHRYSADEEPVFQVVILLAHNAAQEMVYGDEAVRYVIPKFDMIRRNFLRLDEKAYPVVRGSKRALISMDNSQT